MKKVWIDSDVVLSKGRLRTLYRSLLPTIRRVARANGYAIGVHGSETRDLDLIAVPWVKGRLVQPRTLASRIHRSISKYWLTPSAIKKQGTGGKPHGREAYVLYLGTHRSLRRRKSIGVYVDLSIIPPRV